MMTRVMVMMMIEVFASSMIIAINNGKTYFRNRSEAYAITMMNKMMNIMMNMMMMMMLLLLKMLMMLLLLKMMMMLLLLKMNMMLMMISVSMISAIIIIWWFPRKVSFNVLIAIFVFIAS